MKIIFTGLKYYIIKPNTLDKDLFLQEVNQSNIKNNRPFRVSEWPVVKYFYKIT
jgi:hypothetical protein